MNQIHIGTCVPGQHAMTYLPAMVDKATNASRFASTWNITVWSFPSLRPA